MGLFFIFLETGILLVNLPCETLESSAAKGGNK